MANDQEFSTLLELFTHATARFAERPLFGTKRDGAWQWTTYADFSAQVDAVRASLAAHGIGRGDRVAMLADNRVEWAVACYAALGLGAQFVPMYEAQLPKDWKYILADSGTKAIFVANDGIAEQIGAFRSELPALEHVFVLDGPDWATLCAGGETYVPLAELGPEDVAGFVYTSGTTGDPKGVLLSHGNLASNVSAIRQVFDLGPEDRSLSFLPWAHSFGQTAELHFLFSVGASMAIAESVPQIVPNLGEVQPTVLIAVPRIFNRIHDGLHKRMAETGGLKKALFERAVANAARRRELREQGSSNLLVDLQHALYDRLVFATVRGRFGGRLRFAVSGGAALNPDVAALLADMGILVYEGYGATETSPVVAANTPAAARLGTVGKPLPGVRIELDHDITGDPADGEIIVHGPNVMKGYHGLPEEDAKVFTADRGYRTGDMGRLDADGFLRITGRIKEQYKLENGKYVVPSPLEERMKLAPLIANVLLHGSNRPYNVALIVPDWEAVATWARDHGVDGSDHEALLSDTALRTSIERQLATQTEPFKHYERPKTFALISEDFTTENGLLTPSLKVKRRAVLERYGNVVDGLYS